MSLKPKERRRPNRPDDDTMWPEYYFSKGIRGKHAARYAEASNVVD